MSRKVVVQAGDTLSRIGRVVGVPWLELAKANGIAAPYVIRAGQELVVPGSEEPKLSILGEYRVQMGPFTRHRWVRSRPVRWIIIHDPVGGSVGGTLSYLRSNVLGSSYHYVVCPSDGPGQAPVAVCLAAPVVWCVGHAGVSTRIPGTRVVDGAVNEQTASVSIYKHKTDNGPFPPEMVAAAADLVADMIIVHGLSDAGVVLAHREISTVRGRRSDPRGLDMDVFRQMVAARL